MNVFFAGDVVHPVRDGHSFWGVIRDFTYDVAALERGEPGDVANVAVIRPAGPHKAGDLIAIPVAELVP